MQTSYTPLQQGIQLAIGNTTAIGTRGKTEAELNEVSYIPYANSMGILMYFKVCYMPDMTHAMSVVSRFMGNLGKTHSESVKWPIRYLKVATKRDLKFQRRHYDEEDLLVGFLDTDYAANLDTRKSLTVYVFSLYGTTISWKSSYQSEVALSPT